MALLKGIPDQSRVEGQRREDRDDHHSCDADGAVLLILIVVAVFGTGHFIWEKDTFVVFFEGRELRLMAALWGSMRVGAAL